MASSSRNTKGAPVQRCSQIHFHANALQLSGCEREVLAIQMRGTYIPQTLVECEGVLFGENRSCWVESCCECDGCKYRLSIPRMIEQEDIRKHSVVLGANVFTFNCPPTTHQTRARNVHLPHPQTGQILTPGPEHQSLPSTSGLNWSSTVSSNDLIREKFSTPEKIRSTREDTTKRSGFELWLYAVLEDVYPPNHVESVKQQLLRIPVSPGAIDLEMIKALLPEVAVEPFLRNREAGTFPSRPSVL
ncbi:hypothetical protein BXZ70DRAFT_7457 [Cristinia sonorae]|uniref:Uncharacterized protein n=1 Tax=Cristinia sonorae TaxID=1940300 RepID=A0A8K0UZA2_9AGAR|nr:hypothetical protein BXZ70DRAFT_7457 [Cristinia sonorae]